MGRKTQLAERLVGAIIVVAIHLALGAGCIGSAVRHDLAAGSCAPDEAPGGAALVESSDSSTGEGADTVGNVGAGTDSGRAGNAEGGESAGPDATRRAGGEADGGASAGTGAAAAVTSDATGDAGDPDSTESARRDAPPPTLTPFDNFHPIAKGRAYRSGQLSAEKLRHVVEAYEIKTVVNLRGPNPGREWYDEERAACAAAGVRMVDVPLSAGALPSKEHVLALYDLFQDESVEPLLIHCRGGADRSGMIAAMWRMEVLGDDRETALRELSWLYGHFPARFPDMTAFIRMFEPSREWIEQEYNPAGGGEIADE